MKVKSIKALNDYVFVEPVVLERVTKSGIILTDISEDVERPNTGVVVAKGEGYQNIDVTVNEGEMVVFHRAQGSDQEFTIEGQKKRLKVLRQVDLFGVLEVEEDD